MGDDHLVALFDQVDDGFGRFFHQQALFLGTIAQGISPERDYTLTKTYIGPPQESVGKKSGEMASYRARYSAPPESLRPGERLRLDLVFETLGADLSFFNFHGFTSAQLGTSKLETTEGDSSFRLDNKVGLDTIEETLSIEMPLGSEGQELELMVYLSTGPVMRTRYTYRYQMIADAPPAETPPSSPGGTITLRLGDPNMMVDGVRREVDPGRGTVPRQIGGRVLIPIAAVIQSMDGEVGWDGTERKVTIKARGNRIAMWLDRTTMEVNGERITVDVAPVAINGRTFVPVRFATENLGARVGWDGSTQTVTIRYD